MAVPKQRKTKSRRNNRRMHIKSKHPSLSTCPKCGKPVKPHTVCKECGFYKGKEVINVLEKLTKKERKAKEKEMETKGKELNPQELSKKQ